MTYIVVIANQKYGVGKIIAVLNLCVWLAVIEKLVSEIFTQLSKYFQNKLLSPIVLKNLKLTKSSPSFGANTLRYIKNFKRVILFIISNRAL